MNPIIRLKRGTLAQLQAMPEGARRDLNDGQLLLIIDAPTFAVWDAATERFCFVAITPEAAPAIYRSHSLRAP